MTHDLRLNVMAGNQAGVIVVEAFEAVHTETSLDGRDWVVQHLQHPTRNQITKLKAMRLSVQTSASVDYSKGAEVYVKRFNDDEVWACDEDRCRILNGVATGAARVYLVAAGRSANGRATDDRTTR